MASFVSFRTLVATGRLGLGRQESQWILQQALRLHSNSVTSKGRPPLPPSPRIRPTQQQQEKPTPSTPSQQQQQAPSLYARTRDRGPVSWVALFLYSVMAASAVAYYSIERERRLERAMGQVVSSESDDGWTPRPDYLAKRRFVPTRAGWFPVDDGFGASEFSC